ncbi:uncharacterized protein MELLADRAFT_85239 [Melampsora larici-populina 98AG31]|uniref:CxC5 like cysteine cluster associated with KDZ domain-containing protein n=1 Tax=Melampsora larici-populina (strain 98AG31 / pathotype 3-4-7) TaxID=747676 RepID=F4RI16_MELLP|nr:uncharacterized protein MELLADRAFT_85239 [Melampsora larici-populina 98AG31]EGG08034.1 hypothetical protein MELLADRAFT_85239 [Melampsora larici-populina 98AG31]
MLLIDFVAQMSATSAQLSNTLTVTDFVRFMTLASEVNHIAGNAIRLTPHRPTVLPFLTTALSPKFPDQLIHDLWTLAFPLLPSARFDPKGAIRSLGLQFKLPEKFLRPPVSRCIVCPAARNLHVHMRLDGYLFDTDGVHTVQTVILDCPGCGSTFCPSYYTTDKHRHYYTLAQGRDVEILHVHCHYYMTNRLGHLFRVIQMLAHVSHFNLTNWYNEIYVENMDVPQFGSAQVFTPALSEAVCLDGLELCDLLEHEDRRGNQVVLPASGTNSV